MADFLCWIIFYMFCFGITFRYKGKRYVWSGRFTALVEQSVYDRARRIAKARKLCKKGNMLQGYTLEPLSNNRYLLYHNDFSDWDWRDICDVVKNDLGFKEFGCRVADGSDRIGLPKGHPAELVLGGNHDKVFLTIHSGKK